MARPTSTPLRPQSAQGSACRHTQPASPVARDRHAHSVSDTGVRTAGPHLSALNQHEGEHAATRNLLHLWHATGMHTQCERHRGTYCKSTPLRPQSA